MNAFAALRIENCTAAHIETFQDLDRKAFMYISTQPSVELKLSVKHLNLVCAALQGWGGG